MDILNKLKTIFNPYKKILFYRNFQGFTGGHLKVWDYFNHVNQSKQYNPQIYFSPATTWDNNPWLNVRANQVWQPKQADCLFLAGLDWEILTENPEIPIINLIQHVRHAVPTDPRYGFLRNKAIRICVSEEVTEALHATQQVNGPIFTNPNGIDIQSLPEKANHSYELLIAGLKQPDLARKLQQALAGKNIKILTQQLPRTEFLATINQAKITVFLPSIYNEGFFLPALEGMALNTLVICPDCIGNRSFCKHNFNCLMPDYTFDELLKMSNMALSMPKLTHQTILANAKQTSEKYTIIKEQQKFVGILDNILQIW